MIVEMLLNVPLGIVSWFLDLIPDFTFDISVNTFTTFFQFLRMAGYILPMGTVAFILGTLIAIQLMRILIALFRFLLSMVPFVG